MYVVLYNFIVKPGEEESFMDSWKGLTSLIYQYEGSLGSRLHKKDELNYIAYAQWPNKLTFDNSGNNLPEEASYYRNRMRSSCEKVVVLEKLEVIADLTKNKQSEK